MPKTSIRPSRGETAVGWLRKMPPRDIQSEVCHSVVVLELELEETWRERAQIALSVPRAKRKVVGGVANCAEARICGQMVPWQAEGGWFEEMVVGTPNAGWGWDDGGMVVVVGGGETCSAVEEEEDLFDFEVLC